VTRFLQVMEAAAVIAGLLAVQGVAMYAMWWFVMWVVRLVPMIGKRHLHARWDELNDREGRSGSA
jgi:hypothetical protein